jgi:hypothetical protein
LCYRSRYRRKMTGGGNEHSDHAQRHSARCALQSDSAHSAADVNKLVHFAQ